MTQNAIIGFPSLTQKFTYSGGSYNSSYPVTNMQSYEYARVARTANLLAASCSVTGVSPSIRSIRMFGLGAHNMTLNATYRLRIYDDTDSPEVLVYDSGTQDVWPSVYTYAGRLWDTENFWTGQYTDDEIEGQVPFRPILLDDNYLGNKFVFDFSDPTNGNGFIDIGLLEVTSGWQLSVNPEMGARFGYNIKTRSNEIDGGLKRFDVYDPAYVFQGSIPVMDREEVQNQAMELYRQYGINRPFMWLPEPDEQTRWLRNSKMVTLVNPELFAYVAAAYESVPLNLEEWKG